MPTVVKIDDQKPSTGTLTGLPESVRSLTHDLRTPLTSVKSGLSLVLNGEAGDVSADQRRFLTMALRNIDRLDRMIEGLLARESGREGTRKAVPREVDLGPVLREAAASHRVTAEARNLELDDSGLPESFLAQVDPDLVVRMLDNVLGNALKFTGPRGRVRVWLETGCARPRSLAGRLARHCGQSLATFNLIVEDNGPGLSTSVQSRIFEPFNRGAGTDRAAGPGSGLGLSITRRLAESLGGTVRLISLPGRGTTVWIKLPRDVVSARFQQTVDRMEAELACGSSGEIAPLLGVLDLRRESPEKPFSRALAEEFVSGERAGGPRAWEPAPGLWVAPVMDPVNWSRRWTLFAARRGRGLESLRWDYLPLENTERKTVTSRFGEQRETMVNSASPGPKIVWETTNRQSTDQAEDG